MSYGSDGTWGGYCIPSCYVSGQQPNAGATDKDLCWPSTNTITPGDMATASTWLEGEQPGCVKNAGNGFCSCATDWTA